ncbi:MAG: hypothetical protein JW893_08400, partial [Candidatus Omnitrophica bacterium]|nr:hypothetical protein [Candidatus Omnitrophota bacterium]
GLLSKESIPDGFRIMLGETLIGFASRSAVWQLRENWTIETTFPSERQGLIQGRVVQVDNSIFVNDAVRDWMVREGLLSKESIPDGFRIMLGETLIGFASLSAVGQLRENGAIATALRSELREGAVTRSEVRSIAGVYNWQAFPGYEIRVETGQDQLRVRIQSPSAHYRGRIDQTYDLNRYQFVQGMTLESYILDTLTALSISAPVNSIPLIGGLIRMATRGTRFDHSFQEFYEILGGLEAATISPATTEQTARPSGKIDRGIRLIVDAYKKSAGSRPFRDDVFNKSLESVKQQIGDSLKDVLLEILTNDHWEEGLGLHTVETNFIINIAKTMLSRLVALRPDLADENVSKALREATARSPISRSEEAQYALANSIPEALERIQRRDPIRLDWKKYKGISDYMILAAPGSARSKIELKMVGGDSVNEGTVSFSQLQELFESLQTSVGVLEMERLENIKQGHADEPLEHGVDFRVAFGDFIKRHGLRFRSELRLTNVTDNVQTLYDMASQYSYSGVTPRLGLSESHLAAMLFFVENSPDLSTEVPAEIQALPNAPQLIQRFNLGSRVLNSFRAQFPEAPLVLQQMIHGAESFNLRDVVSGYGAYRETSRTEQAESITVVDQLPGLEIASQAGAAADRSFIAPKGVSAIGSVRATPFLSPAAMMELIRQGVDGVRPEQLVALLTMGFVPNANAATVAEVVSLIEPGIAESFRKIMDQYPQLASGNEPASVVVVTSDVPTAQELGLVQFMLAVNPGQSFRFVVPVFEDNQLETALAQVDTISESAKAWVDINGQPIGRERFRIFVQPLTTARGIKGFGGVLNGQINQLHSQLRIQNPDIAIGDHIAVMPMGVGRVQDLVTTSSIAARLLRNQSHEMSLRSAATFVGNRFAHYNGNAELLNAELIRQEDATEAVVVRGRDGYEINTASLSQLVSLIAQAQAEIMAAISA